MMSNIVGVPNTPEDLVLDMELQVTFEQRGDMSLPVFTPAERSELWKAAMSREQGRHHRRCRRDRAVGKLPDHSTLQLHVEAAVTRSLTPG